jgi:hypothetical protein
LHDVVGGDIRLMFERVVNVPDGELALKHRRTRIDCSFAEIPRGRSRSRQGRCCVREWSLSIATIGFASFEFAIAGREGAFARRTCLFPDLRRSNWGNNHFDLPSIRQLRHRGSILSAIVSRYGLAKAAHHR